MISVTLCYVRVCREEDHDCETENCNIVSKETNFEDVMTFISDEIIGSNRTCSMELLTEIYGLDPKDRKHRLRLKEKLISEFKDSLIFANVTYHSPQIVICAECFKSTTFSSYMNESKDYTVRKSAMYLREDILNMIKEAPNLPWPPKVDDLNDEKRQPPEGVKYVYKNVINDTHHIESEQSRNFTLSFAQDLVHAVSR